MVITYYNPSDAVISINGSPVTNIEKAEFAICACGREIAICACDGEFAICACGREFAICACGRESDFGCHGFRDGSIYSEYFCKKCYHKEKT